MTVIRCLAHMDSAEAARLAHIRSERLRALEEGEEEPFGSDLAGLADAYGVTVDFLLDTASDSDPARRENAAESRRTLRRGRTAPVYDMDDPDDVACMLDIALARSGVTAGESRRLIESLDS